MKCDKARANLSAYVEQELSEKDRREVSTHLGRCESCSRDLFAMQKAINLLRWVPRVDARPGFDDRLRLRLRTEDAQRTRWASLMDRVRELAGRVETPSLRAIFGETLVATPASALFLALLFGTGGGALLMHQVMHGELAERVAATPEIMSAPNVVIAAAPAPAEPAPIASPVDLGPARVATHDVAALPSGPASPANPPAADAVRVAASGGSRNASPAPQAAAVDQATNRPASPARRVSRPATEAPILTASNPSGANGKRVGGAPRTAGSRVDVAPWATNQQPIEGPPAVSQVEYILDLVDVNQERVLQLPASAVVSGSTVTF